MTPAARWQAVKQLFDACLDLPPEGRAAWLQERTTDAELVQETLRLLRQHDSASGFLETPPAAVSRLHDVAPAPVFQPGQEIGNRYRIQHLLGRGGMGEVYSALDGESGERIAIKVLTGHLSFAPRRDLRFRRELRLARRITHPNVCRIFDIQRHSSESTDFLMLTMELVDGMTLAELLRQRGSLPADDAMTILSDVAAGLGTAHRAGIVHRDLKPSNIMVELRRNNVHRAVIMDFGLAIETPAADESSAPLTATGEALGTLDYMAPEQLQGGPISHKTDLYALGLVMHEMVTGVRPLAATTPVATALRRLAENQVDLPASTPVAWRSAILRCLERDAVSRPESVEEVCRLIGQDPARRRLKSSRKWTRRHTILGGAAAGVALSGFVFFPRLKQWSFTQQLVSTVMLAPIRNMTGKAVLDNTTLLLSNQLSQSAHFQVLTPERITELLRQMRRDPAQPLEPRVAREVALRASAQGLVYGTLSPVGSELTLDLRMELLGSRPDSAIRSWPEAFRASDTRELMRAVQLAGIWIRQKAGEAPVEIAAQDRTPADVTTGDWDALQQYTMGRQRRAEGDLRAAEVLFREAIQIDREFVSAHRDLADLLVAEYRFAEGFEEHERAITIARDRKLTNWERYRLEAMYWDDANDWVKAQEIYRAWSVHYPKDYVPVFYDAGKLSGLGRTDEAIGRFRDVLKLRDYFGAYQALCNLAIVRGDRAGVADALRNLRRLGEADRANVMECRASFVVGERAKAVQLAAQVAGSSSAEWARRGRHFQALLAAEEGDLGGCQVHLEALIGAILQTGNRAREANIHVALAHVLWRMGKTGSAREHTVEALRLEPGPGIAPRAAHLLSLCGDTHALRELAAAVHPWPALPYFEAAKARVQGEWSLLQRRPEAALKQFRLAASLVPPVHPRDFLAFALDRAGDTAASSQIYRALSLSPALVWREPEEHWPGLCAYCRERLSKL